MGRFCVPRGREFCLPRGHPRAFDTLVVSYPKITNLEDFTGNIRRLAYLSSTRKIHRGFWRHVLSILLMHFFFTYHDRTYTAKSVAIDVRESMFFIESNFF